MKFLSQGLGTGLTLTRKLGWQETNLAREHLAYLSLNFLAQKKCRLLLSANLFKMKISVSKKQNYLHFEPYKEVLDVFYETVLVCQWKWVDILKPGNADCRVYNHDIVTYEQDKLGLPA